MSAAFTFDPALHEYRLDGQRLPSVTQLLEPIKPDFSMVPRDVLEAKRSLGVAVHLACELDDQGELDDGDTDAGVMAYVAAWRRFKLDTSATVLANERRLYHPTLYFAGTVDRVIEMTLRDSRAVWIVDLKTGDEPYASYGVQLAGYELLLNAEAASVPAIFRRASLHLRADGTYRLHQFNNPNDKAAFMACLAIHSWKEAQR